MEAQVATIGLAELFFIVIAGLGLGMPAGSGVGLSAFGTVAGVAVAFSVEKGEQTAVPLAVVVEGGDAVDPALDAAMKEEATAVPAAEGTVEKAGGVAAGAIAAVGGEAAKEPSAQPTTEPAEAKPTEGDPVDRILAVTDKICACKDMACVTGLQAELSAAGKAMGADPTAVSTRAKDIQEAGRKLSACMTKLASGAVPK